MDSYNKLNQIAFKLLTEMTSNAYAVWDESNHEYLATNDLEAAKKKALQLSAQKKNNIFFVMDMEEVGGQGMNNEDPLDQEHYNDTVLFSYMNGQEEDPADHMPEEKEVEESANLIGVSPRNEQWRKMVSSVMEYLSSAFKKNVKDTVRLQDDIEEALKPVVEKYKQREAIGPQPRPVSGRLKMVAEEPTK